MILNRNKIDMAEAKILVLGITFKEDCPDVRNSKVIDLINEIKLFRSSVDVYDPIANRKETRQEFKINIIDKPRKSKYDLVVIAVGHQIFKKIVKTTFNLRRKKIRNSLKTLNYSQIKFDSPIFDKRPEELEVLDFINLTNLLNNENI